MNFNFTKKQEDYDFLPSYLEVVEKPIVPMTRVLNFIIIIFLSIILLWSFLGKIDINANAKGLLVLAEGSKIVQARTDGEITSIKVKNGQQVQKGQELILLDTTTTNANYAQLLSKKTSFQLERAIIEALLSKNPLENLILPKDVSAEQKKQTRTLLSVEFNEYKQQIKYIDSELEINKANINANELEIKEGQKLRRNILFRLNSKKKLLSKNAIAKIDILEQEKELLDIDMKISNLQSNSLILERQRETLEEKRESVILEKKLSYYKKLNELKDSIQQIELELLKAKEEQRIRILKAPVDGLVQQLSVQTLGGVVSPAEQLMVIVPLNKPIEAEVNILNKDIGFVEKGQKVEIKIDSFPFTKYGTISGEVLYVSKDAIEHEKLGYVFPARIILDRSQILVGSTWVNLSSGMSVTVDIKTGKRRIIEYLLSPIQRYQNEALRER